LGKSGWRIRQPRPALLRPGSVISVINSLSIRLSLVVSDKQKTLLTFGKQGLETRSLELLKPAHLRPARIDLGFNPTEAKQRHALIGATDAQPVMTCRTRDRRRSPRRYVGAGFHLLRGEFYTQCITCATDFFESS
jgi:hypothetical protein